MKKDKRKPNKLEIEVDLKKNKNYHFVNSLPNTFFPYEPYPEQLEIIKTIQEAVKNKENSLIQSPTGTGKTLCLLIGALSSLMGQDIQKKKIFYLTRTHSQITQIISEFKKTVYNCNINVIASREQLCINHNLNQLKGKYLEKACSQLCNQNLCPYREFGQTKIPKAMNLQDFKDQCKRDLICPYFFSKQLTQKCEMTILPFNYLTDWTLFCNNSLELKDSVIVFDEAHNIDTLFQQGSNIDLSSDQIALSINQLRSLSKVFKKRYLHKQFSEGGDQFPELEDVKNQLQSLLTSIKVNEEIHYYSRNHFLQKMEEYTSQKIKKLNSFDGIDLGNYGQFCSKARSILKMFHKKQLPCNNLLNIIDLIEKIYNIANSESEFSKFHTSLVKEGQKSFIRMRCLDPSIAFIRIINAKPRSVILSSGTLGCLNDWQSTLKVNFKYKLNVTSFIKKSQLYAVIKQKSQNGVSYNFSYQKKHSEQQYEQLVNELKQLQKIVSHGIVVAFSNYQLMEKTIKHSFSLTKKVYFESKSANIDEVYLKYSESANQEGAFLFIIIRGRFSEGINFTDKLCRCLVVVGIPYLPLKNTLISEKIKYITSNESKESADKWYTKQTFKSLNQTLGRVIRNKNDYGIILLLDQRYEREEIVKQFSSWFTACLRKNVNTYQQIQSFLKNQTWLKVSQCKQKILVNHETEKIQTKTKNEPSLCERLLQFETPTKTNKNKKLKICLESQRKEKMETVKMASNRKRKERNNFLDQSGDNQLLKQFDQPKVFKEMKKELQQFFILPFNFDQNEVAQTQAEMPKDQNQGSEVPLIRMPTQLQTTYVQKRKKRTINLLDF